ncbi:MAG: hypothetical protein J5497_04475 [Selenomonadaceae bacterium]|nr:hypothetical protein [Selenomonadaceae bacterium]
MLISNPFRFGTDTFDYSGRRALLVSNEALDFTEQTNVDGFIITGSQPADTDRRIIFKIDDALYKFNASTLIPYTGDGEFADVISKGNTVEQLTALTDIPAFVGKLVYPIIALKAGWTAASMPTIKIAAKARNVSATYVKKYNATVHELKLDDPSVVPRISEITPDITSTGNASCVINARVRDAEGNWSAWMPLNEIPGQYATAIDFQIFYTVTTLDGTDSVLCNAVYFKYNTGAVAVNSNSADIYSVVQNYQSDLQTCYVVVRHSKLIDSTIDAYVNFMPAPKHRDLITLGTTTGFEQQLSLGVNGVKDTGVDQSSIKLFADGDPLLEFDYNTETSEVTVALTAGKVITASYDYGRGSEVWVSMVRDGEPQLYPDDGTYMSRYTYTLPDNQTAGKQISNVRLKLTRPVGPVRAKSLGTATGKTQQIILPHAADADTIKLNAEWTYNEDSQILTFIAPKNTALSLSYNWRGEQIKIHSFASGWVAAI